MKDHYILIYLHRIIKKLDKQTTDIARVQGVTLSQFAVLEALQHKGPMTVGQIKDAILSSDGTIPVVISNLCKAGLVQKMPDPHNRRRSIVSLTHDGLQCARRISEENDRMICREFSCWDDREKRDCIRFLRRFPLENR